MSLAEIQEAIEKLGPEERAELWTWFQEAEETDELVAAVDEGIQAAEEGRVFSLEEIKGDCGSEQRKCRKKGNNQKTFQPIAAG